MIFSEVLLLATNSCRVLRSSELDPNRFFRLERVIDVRFFSCNSTRTGSRATLAPYQYVRGSRMKENTTGERLPRMKVLI